MKANVVILQRTLTASLLRTIEQLNTKLDQLDRDLDLLFSDLSTYGEEVLRQSPTPGVWSPFQVVELPS